MIDALKGYGRNDICVIVGGVIPQQDHAYLKEKGVKGIYGPGTKISETAIDLLSFLMKE